MNRRQFLHSGLAVTSLAATTEGQASPPSLPIIDTHQHLWDLKKFKLSWIQPGTTLARNYLLADYRKASEGLNVVRTIYMEVDVDPAQQDAEADYVLDLCRRPRTRLAGAVISGRPASDRFRQNILRFKDNHHLKGVRQVLHATTTPPGYCLSPAFIKGIQFLGELGMSYDLCLRPGELLDGARLIDACPGTQFILDHCGNANVQAPDRSQWQRDMAAVARRKNVVCKVSGIVASARPKSWTADDLAPIVRHTLEVFGPDRVMFGGDWPVCTLAATLRQWVEALQAIVRERKVEEQRKLFHDNAVKIYRLPS